MKLTKTEFTVAAYIGAGYDVKEIANKVFRSYHTIASQVKTIRHNNNLKNLAEITRDFTLEFGDPRKFVAVLLITLQSFGMVAKQEVRRVRRKRTSRTVRQNLRYENTYIITA